MIEYAYSTITSKKINLKENVLEKFLSKVEENNSDNFEKVEQCLIKTNLFLTPKILEKIIEQYYKVTLYDYIEKRFLFNFLRVEIN